MAKRKPFTPEQRLHWNEYNNEYQKKNYRNINVKLNKATEQDIIDFLDQYPGGVSAGIKAAIRKMLKK